MIKICISSVICIYERIKGLFLTIICLRKSRICFLLNTSGSQQAPWKLFGSLYEIGLKPLVYWLALALPEVLAFVHLIEEIYTSICNLATALPGNSRCWTQCQISILSVMYSLENGPPSITDFQWDFFFGGVVVKSTIFGKYCCFQGWLTTHLFLQQPNDNRYCYLLISTSSLPLPVLKDKIEHCIFLMPLLSVVLVELGQ